MAASGSGSGKGSGRIVPSGDSQTITVSVTQSSARWDIAACLPAAEIEVNSLYPPRDTTSDFQEISQAEYEWFRQVYKQEKAKKKRKTNSLYLQCILPYMSDSDDSC